MKNLFISILLLFSIVNYSSSQVEYMDEDASGNWTWKEVVEYDNSEVTPEVIIENIAQWFDNKKTLFNLKVGGTPEWEGLLIEECVLEKKPDFIRGFLHGRVARTGTHSYVVRLFIDVEVREGRFRITFSDMTALANIALGITLPNETPTIITKKEVAETFKKKKGDLSLDETIARLIGEISDEGKRAKTTEDNDDW